MLCTSDFMDDVIFRCRSVDAAAKFLRRLTPVPRSVGCVLVYDCGCHAKSGRVLHAKSDGAEWSVRCTIALCTNKSLQ